MTFPKAVASLALLLTLSSAPALARADVAPRCRCDAPGRTARAGLVLPFALAALVPIVLRRLPRRSRR
jgi:hypothetical protein